MAPTRSPASAEALLESARASRVAAAAFRAEVERLKSVSFEGTLNAVVLFRLMAREMAAGVSPSEAGARATAEMVTRRGADVLVAAE